jgi:hypothetical protein
MFAIKGSTNIEGGSVSLVSPLLRDSSLTADAVSDVWVAGLQAEKAINVKATNSMRITTLCFVLLFLIIFLFPSLDSL